MKYRLKQIHCRPWVLGGMSLKPTESHYESNHGEALARDFGSHLRRRDPERAQEWMGELSKADPVVVYCTYGFHVGCRTTVKLREAGFDARYMTSGHSGWKALGGEMELRP